jgi:glyoxylase-like metal-dependent hydrolase (beta-lactamase superfamily II)
MNLKSKFFDAREIAPGTTAISGLAMELCFLLEGKEKALLIDTLSGAGNLRAFVRELTDLPVTVAITHSDFDHVSGAFDYDACVIHPADISLIYEIEVASRMDYTRIMMKSSPDPFVLREDDFTPRKPLKTYPLYDGTVFDLGGRVIETIAVPGHTRGSVVFLDRAIKTVFSGDALNVNTILFMPRSPSIEEYGESLEHFKSFQPAFDVMYGGHNLTAVPKVIIDEAIELCGLIMKRADDKVPAEFFGMPCLYAKQKNENFQRLDGKIANIAYSENNIFKKKD